jgi:hypothetical protein
MRVYMDRIYMGCVISRCAFNASGMRWYARTPCGDRVLGETLEGIKRAIRESVERAR